MNPIPLCKDCRCFGLPQSCLRVVGKDPVFGGPTLRNIDCYTERANRSWCGPDGRFFEPKEPPSARGQVFDLRRLSLDYEEST